MMTKLKEPRKPQSIQVKSMSESEDVNQLAQLLREQKELAIKLAKLTGNDKESALKRLNAKRSKCLELVDRYFRQVLEPILTRQFAGKVHRGSQNLDGEANVGVMVQFTQLLNDFFVQVLSKFEDPFWEKTSAIELRNFAAWAIANDVRDELRRRNTGEGANESYFWKSKFADEAQQRSHEIGVDLSDALDVIEQWETHSEQDFREYASLLRHFYISGMSMEEISSELSINVKTAYRKKQRAISELRQQLEATLD